MRSMIKPFFREFSELNPKLCCDQRILINELSRVFEIPGAAAATFIYKHDHADLKSEPDLSVLEEDLVPILRERMTLVERAQVAEELYQDLSVDDDPFTNTLLRYGMLLCIGALLTGNPCWIRKTHPVWDLLVKRIDPDSRAWLYVETYEDGADDALSDV